MSSNTREKTVGFVGLGVVGGPMAANILKAGHPLVAYDIDREKTERIATLGAQIGSGPAEVASRAQRVVSMVTPPRKLKKSLSALGGLSRRRSPAMS